MTGASSGIGSAIAKKLLRSGANVIMFGRDISKLQQLNIDPKKLGQSYIFRCDLTRPLEVEEIFLRVVEFFQGRIDVLINAAGILLSKDYMETTLPEYDYLMTLNVRAPMQLMSMATPWLKQYKGCVVNVSASAVPRPRQTLFCVTKS
jgi:short-subunit dehydrogenase